MKLIRRFALFAMLGAVVLSGCKSMTAAQKGAIIGTVGGAAAGAISVVQQAILLSVRVGATRGGVTGAIIGNKMDKQAEEMKAKVPEATVERVGEGIIVELPNSILFGFDSSTLSAEAKANLDKMITVFSTYPDTDIEIQGHTDNTGAVPTTRPCLRKGRRLSTII